MKALATVTILFLLAAISLRGQADTSYAVELNMTISPSFSFFENERYEGAHTDVMFGTAFTARAMWHPSRLLAFGLLTGYTQIASEALPSDSNHTVGFPTRASLTSVPFQAVVSMQGPSLEVGVCMGPHLMMTTIDDGKPAHGSRIELNLTVLANYRFILSSDLYIAPELRFSYFSYRGVLSVLPSLTIRYDLFHY